YVSQCEPDDGRELEQCHHGDGHVDVHQSRLRIRSRPTRDDQLPTSGRRDEQGGYQNMTRFQGLRSRQAGMLLVSSMLLLVIVTILALSMFRSVGVQQKIAGNLREKQRALHAAESAQQYAEWWLSNGTNAASASIVCANLLNANLGQG